MEQPWKPNRKFWLFYLLGWIPFFAGLWTVMSIEGDLLMATVESARIVLPHMVLGIAVVKWPPRRNLGRRRVMVRHVLSASAFCVLFIGWLLTSEYVRTQLLNQENTMEGLTPWIPFYMFINLMIYSTLAAITHGSRMAARLQNEERRTAQAELLRNQAELQSLRAQLNPHFMFNTLHSLQALFRLDPSKGEDALDRFGELLRYPMRIHRDALDEVPLDDEWGFVCNYLELEKHRFDDRLQLETHLDPAAEDCLIPAFALQPLVENAVRIAVEPRARGGVLQIRAELNGDTLVLTVADDGPGADPASLAEATGMGLRVVRKRLEALYGSQSQFRVETAVGDGFKVIQTLPVHYETAPTPRSAPV